MLSFDQARNKVIEVTRGLARRPARPPEQETAPLAQADGRVLAGAITADRDYPPFDRSTRDGFAVRASDAAAPGATLAVIGESRAGAGFAGTVGAGQCVEIMTGAPVPAGTDAVVMLEHARWEHARVTFDRAAVQGQNIVARGSEARAGAALLAAGTRLGVAEIALAAQVGCRAPQIFARPRAAVLSTGDELVDVAATPGPLAIRNSNAIALQALAGLAGAEPLALGNARDDRGELRRLIERGLEADLLVLSGGVSKGKYDLVEEVLAELGAEIFFESVAIRPGQPAVFGLCRGKPVFGLPGNPISTIVTFELFVAPAIEILSGAEPQPLLLLRARLAQSVKGGGGLTRFLPARVTPRNGEPEVAQLPWQGSGDLAALAQANAFLVLPPEMSAAEPGEWAMVLLRRGFGGGFC